MIINLEQSERHLFNPSYRVAVFPRIQGGAPAFFHLRHIYEIDILIINIKFIKLSVLLENYILKIYIYMCLIHY